VQVIILAGGVGTRLRPLTHTIPKSMVPIHGKPFLAHSIEMVQKQGFTDIVLSVGYLGGQIEDYFGDGKSYGVNIRYSREKTPLGTGGALLRAGQYLEKESFVLNGDTYLDVDYKNIIEFYRKHGEKAVMVVYNNALKLADNNVLMREGDMVQSYDVTTESDFIDAGVYIFNKDDLPEDKTEEAISLKKAVIDPLITNKCLLGYKTDKRYYDIGTKERIEVFENEVLQ